MLRANVRCWAIRSPAAITSALLMSGLFLCEPNRSALFAQAVASRKPTTTGSAEAIEKILQRGALHGCSVGLHVVSLESGRTLLEHNAGRLLIPASNAKLLTTAAALQVLGPDYQFCTTIGTRGNDLVVVGGGDPAIGGRFTHGEATAYFKRWAGKLRERGFAEFAGDLVLDDSFFDATLVHPRWPAGDLGLAYTAPVAALSLQENSLTVRITPGDSVGSAGRIQLVPAGSGVSVANRTRTVDRKSLHSPRAWLRPGSTIVECSGNVFSGSERTDGCVTVSDPTHYFGSVLRQVIESEGVLIRGKTRTDRSAGRDRAFRPILVHRFPLRAALPIANKESQNLCAEMIFKAMGAVRGDGSWQGGRNVATAVLTALGLDPAEFTLDDGSGLSRSNRVTPRQLTRLLTVLFKGPHGDDYRQSLSVCGVDGTMARRLTDPHYRGMIWAKTGSIDRVRALTGYVRSRDAGWLAFSFLINDNRQSVRAVQDDLCRALVDWSATPLQ